MYIFCCFCIFLYIFSCDHNSDHLFSESNSAVTSVVTAFLYIIITLYYASFNLHSTSITAEYPI